MMEHCDLIMMLHVVLPKVQRQIEGGNSKRLLPLWFVLALIIKRKLTAIIWERRSYYLMFQMLV